MIGSVAETATPSLGWLSNAINETLIRSSRRTVIQDKDNAYTGLDIIKLLNSVKSHLESSTRQGSRIAIYMPNGAAQGIAILAVLYAKRVPVIFSLDLMPGKFEERARKFDCHAVIAKSGQFTELIDIPQILLDSQARVVDIKSTGRRRMCSLPDPRVALVLFTSGSTGEPKAVQLTHEGLSYTVNFLRKYFGLDANSKAGIILPIFHTMALNTQFLPCFLSGGICLFMNSDEENNRSYSMILESKANFLTLIGDILFLYDKERELRGLPAAEDVRVIQMAGGVIRKDHLVMAQKLFPNAVVYKGYGMTEVIRTAMIGSNQPGFLDDSVGYVLPGQTIEIRDEFNNVLKTGETGEIFIKGPNLMLGYQDEGIVFDERGFLASGDLGYLDPKGRLYFCGRTDEIFKTRGKKVSAVEIERTAMAMDIVHLAKCISVPCKRKGYKPVLFVQTVVGVEARRIEDLCSSIRKYLMGQLEKYKVPADVLVVDSIPKLSNQKINRRAIYDMWQSIDEQR